MFKFKLFGDENPQMRINAKFGDISFALSNFMIITSNVSHETTVV